MNNKDIIDDEEIERRKRESDELMRHYYLFKAVICSNSFTGEKPWSIRSKIKILCGYLHGHSHEIGNRFESYLALKDTKSFTLDEMFFKYFAEKHYLKYDKYHSLSTWIVQYIYLNINNLLRRYRPKSVGKDPDSRFDVNDHRNKNFQLSASEYEGWLEIPYASGGPEDILATKQLVELLGKHFTRTDVDVLVGEESMTDVVKRYNWNYDQYSKYLTRRKEKFKHTLKSNGYDLNFL